MDVTGPQGVPYKTPTKNFADRQQLQWKIHCGTSMEATEQYLKIKQDTVVERLPSMRDETCPYGMMLPV